MFTQYIDSQYNCYKQARAYFTRHPQCLIDIEHFVMDEILHFIHLHLPEIIRDYNEASYLYPFWKNYPPQERGRGPIGDQYPWIEVGEQVFGNKLARYFGNNFGIKDAGLPSGADDRCIISSEVIRTKLKITDSVWVFIDIKSAGPRDDYNNAVMSPYQVSGTGKWTNKMTGVRNDVIKAVGKHTTHDFYCSLPPIYVLSDDTIAPLTTFVIKPLYDMLQADGETIGQPLREIKIASIPNGLLLTQQPNYNEHFPGLFYPGKDDSSKDVRKMRARVSFNQLSSIDAWRVQTIALP